MRHDPQIMDYEPVTHPGETPISEEEFMGRRFEKNPSDPDLGPAKPAPISLPARELAREKHEKKPLLKRGHAVSFAGLFLFTFVVYFRPQEVYPSLLFLKNIAFWLALFTLVFYVPTQLALEGRLSAKQREVTCVLFLIIASLVSVPLALDPQLAWNSFIDYLKVVVMFVVMVNVVRTEKRLKALIVLALAASCVMSAAAVNDYRLGHLLQNQVRIEGLIGGLFGNANDLALHLVTMIPIALGLCLGARGVLKKVIFLPCAILFVAGVVATFSRGGFLSLVCVMAALAWRLARRNRVLFLTGGLALVLLVVVVGPGGYRDRLSERTDPSAVARTDELKRSVFLMIRHPLFGLGINNYILFSNSSHASHNAYTQVGSEIGIPGMIVYIMFLITPLKRLREVRRRNVDQPRGRLYYLGVGVEASLIGYMVASFFLSVAYLWYVYYLVAYAITISRLLDVPVESPAAKSISQTLPARSTVLEPNA